MGKKRLTNRQLTRQKSIQAKRLARATSQAAPDTLNQNLGPEQPGLLVAHYGNTLIVENQAGQLFCCGLRQNLGQLVTGDEIIWQQIDENSGVVVACSERRSLITRPDRRTTKAVVSNVDMIVIVTAWEPLPKQTTLDRYLIIAENAKLPAMIIVNKDDLPSQPSHHELRDKLAIYQQIGYPWLAVSTKTKSGLLELEQALKSKTSIFMGQSGVGKSSLLNALVPDAKVLTQELSKIHRLGRHTTTATRLYHLENGGNIIDSPGTHEFKLQHLSKLAIKQGFKEFQPYLGQCKFRNCEHAKEPGCALHEALKMGKIAPFRLQNYHIIISED
jgi:ribosome biogenesis GTPase